VVDYGKEKLVAYGNGKTNSLSEESDINSKSKNALLSIKSLTKPTTFEV